MFRSHRTIIREHVVPIPKLPLIAYKTNYLQQCIVLKIFCTLKPSTHIKINFKNYSNMFRSHRTIIREHIFPIPKLPLIVYKTNYLHQCFFLKKSFTFWNLLHILPLILKNPSNMFRSHWTIIREHVIPIPKLSLIVYYAIIFSSVPCNSIWYTNYKTNYLHQCIVLKNLLHFKTFYTY